MYASATQEKLTSVTRVFEAIPSWFALFPFFVLLVILRIDRKVEKAYFSATLVAACLATGSFSAGSSNIWVRKRKELIVNRDLVVSHLLCKDCVFDKRNLRR